MSAKIIFSEEIQKFVRENYENLGPLKVSKSLGLGYDIVRKCARQLGVKYKARKYEVDFDKFIPIRDAESAYTLGFLWADGSLFAKENGYSRCVSLAFLEEDYNDIKECLLKNINWQVYFRHAINRKPKAHLYFYDNRLGNWFYKVGFKEKSFRNADLLLKEIPESFHSYFWRGYFDGDGSIDISKTHLTTKITSSHSQDWKSVEDLFRNLECTYSIRRTIAKSGDKQSAILIYNLPGILKFLNYIYQNYENDGIGLKRKYEKYITIKNRPVRISRLKSLLSKDTA